MNVPRRPQPRDKSSLSKLELLKTSWKYQAREFFHNSNLHGVRYIAEKDRPFHEKFLWFSFILIGLLVTLVIISSLWEKFQTSPTITGLDTDFHKWDIPFPAITICPKDPTDHQLVQAYVADRWSNLSDEQNFFYKDYITKVANLSYANLNNLTRYSTELEFQDDNLKDILTKVVIRCEDLIYDCVWKGDPHECCQVFLPVLTDHGFCYTFNSKDYEFDFPSLNETQSSNFKIKYIYETDNDLSLVFNIRNIQNNPVSVFIHSYGEKIVYDLAPHHIWTRRVGKIMFSPKETYTTEEARQLSISQRHCVFPDEIRLVTNDEYNFGACMTQCRMNMAKEKCGCIPFFYSKISGYEYCNLNGLVCLARFKSEIQKAFQCQCELSCMHTVYEIEKLEDAKKEDTEEPLEVSFVSWPMIRYKRDVLFGWVDLFVAFGGIAGLFLGFSLLSAIETIYYFTLRAFCMVYREHDQLERLHDEYENAVEPEINLDLKPYFRRKSSPKLKRRTKSIEENQIQIYTIPYLP